MISILNYGLGNIRAFTNIYKNLSIETKVINTPSELESASKLILPGVGSFDWAMNNLKKNSLIESLNYIALEKKIPVLGVCVGMQIMTSFSEEGSSDGLAWVNAHVRKFKKKEIDQIIPHMGWNTIEIERKNQIFNNIDDLSFYFLHSYYVKLNDMTCEIGNTEYIDKFSSAFQSKNLYGVQFHPEKSHLSGIKLLHNFYKI